MTKNTVTYKHNIAMEEIERQKLTMEEKKLMETARHNRNDEAIRSATNDIKRLADVELDSRERDKLAETIRNNIANLQETHQWNLTQEELRRIELDIKRLEAETNQREADIAEMKLQNDLLASSLRGIGTTIAKAGIEGIPAIIAGFTAWQAKKAFDGKSNPLFSEFAQEEGQKYSPSLLAKAGEFIKGMLPSSISKIVFPAAALTATAATLTGSSDPGVSSWRQRREMYDNVDYGRHPRRSRGGQNWKSNKKEDEDEISEEITVNGKTKYIKGGSPDEKFGNQASPSQTFRSKDRSMDSSFGPGSTVESNGNRSSESKVIDNRPSSDGPGTVGAAFK